MGATGWVEKAGRAIAETQPGSKYLGNKVNPVGIGLLVAFCKSSPRNHAN